MNFSVSQRLTHFFHIVSNIKPVVWIGLYVCLTPFFAFIYWLLPEGQFRMPEDAPTDFGAWLYYSIVTISTLGFGDYTPAHPASQAVTAVEVICGLVFLGFFLNSVGAMKSEIDITSEVERQKMIHKEMEKQKLLKSTPMVIHSINTFLAYCYALTTPSSKRDTDDARYNPDFKINDLAGLFEPSGLPLDGSNLPVVEKLVRNATSTSLVIDSFQQRVDLSLWPELLEDCFSFVANCQMFANTDSIFRNPAHIVLKNSNISGKAAQKVLSEKIAEWKEGEESSFDPDLKAVAELFSFVKQNAEIAIRIESTLTSIDYN